VIFPFFAGDFRKLAPILVPVLSVISKDRMYANTIAHNLTNELVLIRFKV